MSDDLDDLLRRTMKTLDDQVPSGYFEGLPTRTLARLEDGSMQTMGTSSDRSNDSASTGVPPMNNRDEDSGLHDIRSLASSTKARLSSRRSTQSPVVNEDDVLASSSAGWKAVALPEPAKMVSLPELASLPSKAEVEALDKAARKAAKAKVAKVAPVAAPAVAAVADAAAPAVEVPAIASIGSRITAKQSKGKGGLIAVVGLGLAAAAGGAFFVMNKDKDEAALSYESKAPTELPTMTAKQLPAPAAVVEPIVEPIAAAEPAVAVAAVAPTEEADADGKRGTGAAKPAKVHKVEIRDTVNKEPKADKAPVVIDPKDEKPKGDGEGEPSFDALLKEAGVSDQKKEIAPKLDKKSLSGGDIKTGMSSIAGKAQGCYKGTQGTAAVKLTVAPSGKVTKATVTGVFAGTPVASCVEAAVKSATFPPWDGGPQSFGYSYLLAE